MSMDARIMEETAYGRAALKKLGDVPDNFRIYSAGWLGLFPSPHGMQVSGAEFRQAKSGPNKGKLHIKIEGTDRTTYVSNAEIEAEQVAYSAKEGAQHG